MASLPTYDVLNALFLSHGYLLPIESYTPNGQLGSGEQGRVFRASRISINKDFAIKVVIPQKDVFTDKEQERFKREVHCMAVMERVPYVVQVVDKFSGNDKILCYVMEFIKNADNLKDAFNKKDKYFGAEREPENLLDILWQVAKGLLYIHMSNVVHRDIKESNVLVKSDNIGGYEAIITDFGFGYRLGENGSPTLPHAYDSYSQEGAALGYKELGLDYFCFSRMIDKCILKSEPLRKSWLTKALKDISARMIEISNAERIEDAENLDKEIIERLGNLRRRVVIFRFDRDFAQLLPVPELTDVGDGDVMRLSGAMTVPLTKRILKIIDTPAFQRLRYVRQLSNVELIYPGASHSRFEHSIGVFNIARMVLRRLIQAQAFVRPIERPDIEGLLLGALLHDIGHISYSHPLEEIGYFNHEEEGGRIIANSDIKWLIDSTDWTCSCDQVIQLITKAGYEDRTQQLMRNILTEAINIDTMDYLIRDSIHAGVPYGQSFDMDRLIFSFVLNAEGTALAVTHKGIVPTETFLVSRYAMFSQVYRHHAARAFTAMLQRAVFEKVKNGYGVEKLIKSLSEWEGNDLDFYKFVAGEDKATIEYKIMGPLAEKKRKLYKRLYEIPEAYHSRVEQLQKYEQRVSFSNKLVKALREYETLASLEDWQLLLDYPSSKYEDVSMQVFFEKDQKYENIKSVSPLIGSLGGGFEKRTRKAHLFVEKDDIKEKILSSLANADRTIEDKLRACL